MKDKILKLLEIILILVVVFSGGICCVDIMQNYHPEFTRNENAMPYTITNTTTTNNPENAKREDAIGSLRCDAAGLAVKIVFSDKQSVCDKKDCAALFSPFETLNLQNPGYAIVADHNYQSFWQLQYMKIGDELLLDSDIYGQFIYTIDDIQIGTQNGEKTDIIMDSGESMMEWCSSQENNGLLLYTCYPFKQNIFRANTQQRYLVFCSLKDCTKLV